jgi:diadenosine tetraphosphatase ApaH/serine/threonine PP2A family protein phosphatase
VIALISDIHSNLEALLAVFAKIDEIGPDEVGCLGDVIGYGPNPQECTDLIQKRCSFTLCGNHDWGLTNDLDDFNPIAREALLMTRRVLRPGMLSLGGRTKERWRFLTTLPDRVQRGDLLFVHASPRDPIKEYVLKTDGFLEPEKMEAIFAAFKGTCFVGHTHWPGLHTADFRFSQATDAKRTFTIGGEPCIVNVGSVGQPRDGDPRACFATLDGKTVEYHRIPYDFAPTQEKIRRLGLNPVLADRLASGR